MLFPQLPQFYDVFIWFLRLVVGIIFLVHGTQKLAAWKTKPSDKVSYLMRVLSIIEPLGALAMIFGFLVQLAALEFIVIMIGAIYFKIFVWKKKFTDPGGWEFDLLLLAVNLFIFFVPLKTLYYQ